MLTKNIEQMTAEIDQHRAADLLVQGTYFDEDTGQGCFIGCLAHGNDAAMIAERFGLPAPLTRLLESIFEGLPFDEAADFFSEIPRAVGEDGRDLTRVHWAFLADLLRHLPDTDARDVVADVIVGMDLLASGKDWPEAEAAAEAAEAADVAYWAARAAYWAAQAAEAEVACWAVERAVMSAARVAAGVVETRRQRDAILRLIRDADSVEA
jgi:Xaa-Pro aminopeptidase